jgi:hypothetical protein
MMVMMVVVVEVVVNKHQMLKQKHEDIQEISRWTFHTSSLYASYAFSSGHSRPYQPPFASLPP